MAAHKHVMVMDGGDVGCHWEAVCRRRFDSMPYGGKIWRDVGVYRDVFTGKLM